MGWSERAIWEMMPLKLDPGPREVNHVENKSRGSEAGTNLECLRNSKTSVNGE